MYGKFLNLWDIYDGDGSPPQAPPYFDDYGVFDNVRHISGGGENQPGCYPLDGQEWCVMEKGTDGSPATRELNTYSTTYVRDQALAFLNRAETTDSQPWFLYLTPTAPHAPFEPEAVYRTLAVPTFTWGVNTFKPFYEIQDCSTLPPPSDWNKRIKLPGKPKRWQDIANGEQCDYKNVGGTVVANGRRSHHPDQVTADRANQLRMLKSVDDMVSQVRTRLTALDEERDTQFFYLSDNGWMWGEHWQASKGKPYTESIKVPFMMRWPGGSLASPDLLATNSMSLQPCSRPLLSA